MASYKEMQDQIEQLQRQAAKQRENELAGAVQEIRKLMHDYGITVEDLRPAQRKPSGKKSASVLFRNPETGKGWSGRGRMPKWLAGQDKEKFRV